MTIAYAAPVWFERSKLPSQQSAMSTLGVVVSGLLNALILFGGHTYLHRARPLRMDMESEYFYLSRKGGLF